MTYGVLQSLLPLAPIIIIVNEIIVPSMDISVIIPTYNEANFIADTIGKVRKRDNEQVLEILVVDSGSTDQTAEKVKEAGATLLRCHEKGRASQMNAGAQQARGDILYFLHADSYPPKNFDRSINRVTEAGYDAGCFRLDFDVSHYGLQFYSWVTRFNIDAFRFGDQSLFIKRPAFFQLQGFREDHFVMEDQEMVRRIRGSFSFKLLDDTVTTSARKYCEYGIIKVQLIFLLIFVLYYLGVDQQRLLTLYQKALH